MGNIAEIQNRCFGCRSCEQVCPKGCIQMKPSAEGFLYPIIDPETCVQCGLCLQHCPAEQPDLHRHSPRHVWGFRNKDKAALMNSASGGAADVAAEMILAKGGVIYGAAYDENLTVVHIAVAERSEKKRLQSSKYVQSDLNTCYTTAKQALEHGKTVLFTGTPCQIAGLYAFLGKAYDKLYTIDLICHGVPSPQFFAKYLAYQQQKLGEPILSYNFRSKEKRGWSTQYLLKTKTKTKTKALALDRYGKHFMDGDCYRACCYQCPFSNTNRVGDLTVGDFWQIAKSHPAFYSPQGVSCVLVNTAQGERLWQQMQQQAEICPATLTEAMEKQGNLAAPTKRSAQRDDFYCHLEQETFIEEKRVGTQVVERVKALLPVKIVRALKKL